MYRDELNRIVTAGERKHQVESLQDELKNVSESLERMKLKGMEEKLAQSASKTELEDEASSIALGSSKEDWEEVEQCLKQAQGVTAALKRYSK